MTIPPSNSKTDRRRPLILVLGGCGVLLLCVMFACVANAGYWTYRMRDAGVGRTASAAQSAVQEVTAEMMQAELSLLPAGDASNGEQLFTSGAACSACHSLDADTKIVGPSLAGIASRSAMIQPDYSAEMYIVESIIYPNAYVVEGFQSSIMPLNFKERLSPQQIADLAAFLMTN